MTSKLLVVGCSQGKALGKLLASNLKAEYSDLHSVKYPDGETLVRFKQKLVGRKVLVVQTMHPSPNDSLVELLFALNTARELGAGKICAVVPYFAYARQDKRFNDGECVSNKIVAGMIEHAGADAFVTVTTHLHRISTLSEVFSIPAVNVLLTKEVADYASAKLHSTLVVGPDWESGPLVRDVALRLGVEQFVFKKKRLSGTRVKNFEAGGLDCKGERILLLDDMASTGNTLISVAKILKKQGAKKVDCTVVHLLDDEGGRKILKNGIDSIACSNSIERKFSKIDCSRQLAFAIERLGF